MITTRQAVEVAAKLYDCQESAKSIYGNLYKERIGQWIEIVKKAEEDYGLETLLAGQKLIKKLSEQGRGIGVMMVGAAMVEILEPNKAEAER